MNSYASMMWALIIVIIAGGVIAVALVFGFDSLAQSRADLEYQKGQARALVIEAQGQSRLDSAQAVAVTSAAMMPWLVVFGVGAMFILALVYLRSQPQTPQQAQRYQPMIIERQVLLLPPGQAELMEAEWQRDRHRIDG